MGIKGVLRSIFAFVRAMDRDKKRRQCENGRQQKQDDKTQELEQAKHEVNEY